MGKRKLNDLVIAAIFAGIVFSGSASAAGEPKMYLCSDSASAGKSGPKLVYGYINGGKTECMTEYEFLALYNQARFDGDSAAQTEKRALVERQAAARGARGDSLADQIRKGRKDLDAADMMDISLEKADLRGASMVSADLRRAKMAGCDLRNANLKTAFLRRADLRGANLGGADLSGAYFNEADLRGAKGLTADALSKAATLYKAKLDNPLLAEIRDAAPEKLKEPSKCWENNSWSDNDDCNPEGALKKPGDSQ
jgi:uncharacterized protein YjbI with pentapeptide repeats